MSEESTALKFKELSEIHPSIKAAMQARARMVNPLIITPGLGNGTGNPYQTSQDRLIAHKQQGDFIPIL